MIDKSKTMELFSALSENMTAEEMMLSSMQALIAAKITMCRQGLGLSQKEFAEKMGVSQTSVSKWESGETNFTLRTLISIASKLGIKMNMPFEMESPLTYSSISSNIVYFPDRWKAAGSSVNKPSYVVSTDELKEN